MDEYANKKPHRQWVVVTADEWASGSERMRGGTRR